MPSLKQWTVKHLRELARKHLGRGHSRLKTREELIAALKKVMKLPVEVAPTEPPPAVKQPPGAQPPRAAPPAPPPPPPSHPAEPLVEGFFVARVQGEDEARVHHLTRTEGPPPRETRVAQPTHAEALPELPTAYGNDQIVLCALDPHTAWTHWDIRPGTRDGAFAGLAAPRVVLRVLCDGREVRRLDVALESRSFYLHGLEPAQHYRVELCALGADGMLRRIAKASNTVQLPSDAVSTDRSVRMMRVPWGLPLGRLREAIQSGEVPAAPVPPPPPTTILHEHWIPGPASGSWQLQRWQEELELVPRALEPLPPPPLPGGPLGSSGSGLGRFEEGR